MFKTTKVPVNSGGLTNPAPPPGPTLRILKTKVTETQIYIKSDLAPPLEDEHTMGVRPPLGLSGHQSPDKNGQQ